MGMVQHRFTCSSCKKGFRTAEALNLHCAAKGHDSFICPGCRQRFASAPALEQHQEAKGHHPPPLSRQLSLDASRGIGSSPPGFTCVVCGASFAGSERFQQHLSATEHYISPRPYQRGDASRWYALGRQFLGARERQQYFERGLQLGRRYLPYSWFGIGCALRQRKDFDGALRAFLNAADLAPHAYRTWVNLSQVLAKLGRIEEAIDACNHALSIDPGRNPRLPAFMDKLIQLQHVAPPPRITLPPPSTPPLQEATGGDQCPNCRGPLCTRLLELGTKIIEVRSCSQCGYKERD